MFSFKKSKSPKAEAASKNDATANSTPQQSTPEQQQQQARLPPPNNEDPQQQLQHTITDLQSKLSQAQTQIGQEKAGKRKIFHSLVKLAQELQRTRQTAVPLMEANQYANQPWYEGGIWRNQVQVLPGVTAAAAAGAGHGGSSGTQPVSSRVRGGEAVSLSDLFLDLVIVTAFTRVGQAICTNQRITLPTILYFAVFWTIWTKEASYSSRFDTSDLSAKVETLLTCFAVLFGSLSASADLASVGATRIMMVAAFCASLHCMLHIRVALVFGGGGDGDGASTLPITAGASPSDVEPRKSTADRVNETRHHVQNYALFNTFMTLLEAMVWILGIVVVPVDSPYRWVVFLVGLLCALRVPRSFLANDFHGTFVH